MYVLQIIKEVNKTLLLSLLWCFTFYSAFAQIPTATKNSTASVEGVVVDSATQAVLSYVSVTLQEAGNSQTFKTTLTDENGYFELTKLPQKKFQLTFTYIGSKTTTIQFSTFATSLASIHLGRIPLVSLVKQLREVQVVTKKQIVERDLDKITYNVDADPDSKTETAFEILRKVPLLTIDAEDNLQLNGNSNYRVLINGKPSSLFSGTESDIYKSFSASAIKTIEVITVPSSRYEAEGIGGIINITTFKKSIGGYSGGINLRASSPKGYATNGNITAKLAKISLSGNYGYSTSSNPTNNNTFFRQDKIQQTSLEQVGTSHNNNASQRWGSQVTYELNGLNSITASYGSNNGSGNSNFIQQVALKDKGGALLQAYNNLNMGKSNMEGNDFTFDYQRSFKKNEARQLTLFYKWSRNTSSNNTDYILEPLVHYNHQTRTTKNEDKTGEHILQADYIQPIKKHTLELGASSTLRENGSVYFYKNMDTITGAFVLDTNQSNRFNYKEDIYAAYTSFSLRMIKWGIRLGVRLEGAKIDANFISANTNAVKDYINLIPNFTLSRQIKEVSMLTLSYTQRMQRPDLYYLNPYVDRTDPLNISFGNPNLQPALAHVFNITYNTSIKKTFINITAFHQFTNNSIQQFTTLNADTISRTTFGNIGKSKNYNLSFSGNTTLIKVLTISLNSSANYAQYTSFFSGKPHMNEGFTYTISGSASLRLKTWRFGGNLSYNAPNILMQGRTGSYVSNSITINKHFLKRNKFNLGLSLNSPFRERRLSFTEIVDPTFYQRRESNIIIRRYNLSFNYRFNKIKD